MEEDILNCCVLCLLPKENDFLEIFHISDEGKFLNKYGKMYEDLLNIKVDVISRFPNFMCSSCSLQLQLSINLKQKGLDSFKKITNLEKEPSVPIKTENKTVFDFECNDNSNLRYMQISELSNENVELHSTETTIREDESNESYESNFSENNYFDDECTEFLDVQYLKEEFDEEFDEKNLNDFKANQFGFSIKNSSSNESENEEIIAVTFDEKDLEKFNMVEIEKIDNISDNIHNSKTIKRNSNSNLKENKKKIQNSNKRIKYVCELCSRVSYSREAFEVHKKVHAGLPAFKCEICQKDFKQKVHYNIHMMNHTNERNYECEECGKKFKTKSDLRIHFEIHTGERRYVCDICNKAYRAHSHMKNHRYTHFEKQLECQICKQKYISPATLKTHIKTIHEMIVPQHECMLCHKKFKRKHHLQVHLKTHNKNKQLENLNGTPLEDLEMTNLIQEFEEVVEEIEA